MAHNKKNNFSLVNNMSAICIVNLKKHNLKFDDLNDLAKELVRYCLNHDNLAVFFHSFDCQKNLIDEEHMRNYFLISDSFLYRNCELLEDTFYAPEMNLSEAEKKFNEKFKFFLDMFEIIFKYNVSELTVLIDDSVAESINDFEPLSATPENFLHLFFSYVVEYADCSGYFGVPSLKITVTPSKKV